MIVAVLLLLIVRCACVILNEEECINSASTGSVDPSLFSLSMHNGWWNCSTSIAMHTSKSNIAELLNQFNMEQRSITTKISNLKSVIESLKTLPTIIPALQWAQSPEFILLNIKFAHIISAPATLNVEASNITITNRKLFLEASDGKKLFRLDLEFSKDVDKDQSTWSMASVGRMVFNIKKADAPSRWEGKGVCKGKGQIQLWYEMQEKHAKQLAEIKVEVKDDSINETEKGKKDDQKKTVVDAKKNTEQDDVETGKIVTPEEQIIAEKRKSKEQELKSAIEQIEKEGKKMKRDLDFEIVDRKKSIDQDIEKRKSSISEKIKAEITAIKTASTTTEL